MTPTREQIIEGRDEALLHLRISPAEWDRLLSGSRQARLIALSKVSLVDRAAALTVAHAEEPPEYAPLQWALPIIRIAFEGIEESR